MNSVPRVLFTAEQIAARVADLAAEIDLRFGERQPLVLVGVLKGSFIFLSDLARRLQTPHRVEFIAVTSYGASTSTEHTGAVRLLMDLRHDIEGAHVLLVEDIVDTGHTLAYLIRLLGARRVVTGRLTRIPPRAWQVSAQWVEVETAELLPETPADPSTTDDAPPAFEEPEPVSDDEAFEPDEEIDNLLRRKRWKQREGPFRGFGSPPGKF